MAQQWVLEDSLQERLEAVARANPTYGHQAAVMELWFDLTTAMKEQRITQTELAERAGLKQSYVSRVLSDPEKISLRTAFRLCNALGLELVVKAQPRVADQGQDDRAERPARTPRVAERRPRGRKAVAAHSG
ncbi:helix-turn-helix domain-containing protein [bacterium]|nr:helix-turn-helix domain-containing protein [bacterium]